MSLNKNIAIVFFERHCNLLISFSSVMILARLLTPREIGVFAIVLGISSVAHMLRDFGVGQYIVQEKELTVGRIRSAFTLSLLVSWSLAALVYFSAYGVSLFYGEEGLFVAIKIISINFVMLPFGSVGLSLLKRKMKFNIIYWINVVPQVVQASLSIYLAYIGFSYLSLAYASVCATACTVILSIVLSPVHYGRAIEFSEIRHVSSYSGSAMLSNLMAEVTLSAPDFIISRSIGFESAALYSRAKGVLSLFYVSVVEAVRIVALPELSERSRSGENLKESFLKSMSLITVLAWPFYGFIVFNAEVVIYLLFGDQWLEAAPVLSVLALSGFVGSMFALGDVFMISMGMQNYNLRLQTIIATVSVLWLFVGSNYGLVVLAYGFLMVTLLRVVVIYTVLRKRLEFDVFILSSRCFKSFLVFFMFISPIVCFYLFFEFSIYLLLLSSFAAVSMWAVGVFVVGHDIAFEVGKVLTDRRLST